MCHHTHRREFVLEEVLLQTPTEKLLADDEIKRPGRLCMGGAVLLLRWLHMGNWACIDDSMRLRMMLA